MPNINITLKTIIDICVPIIAKYAICTPEIKKKHTYTIRLLESTLRELGDLSIRLLDSNRRYRNTNRTTYSPLCMCSRVDKVFGWQVSQSAGSNLKYGK